MRQTEILARPAANATVAGVRDASLLQSLSRHRALYLLLLLALLLRLGWGLSQPATLDRQTLPDQVEYLQLGQNLLHDHQLRFFDGRPSISDMLYAYRTPGYPAFIAALGAQVRLVRIGQALLDTLTVLAVYLLSRRWLDRRTSRAAAGIVAINPFLIYFSGLILSETLFTAMLAWAMVLLAGRRDGEEESATRRRLGYGRFLAGGFLLALSALVRPSALFLPVLLGVGAVWVNRAGRDPYYKLQHPGKPRWRLPVVASMLLLTGLVLLPWAYRNHVVVGKWVWTTTNGGVTLYDGFNPSATGASDQSFLQEMPWLRAPNYTEVERSEYLSNLARQWIVEHPRQAVRLAWAKIGRTWSPIPLSDAYGGQLRYVLVGLLYSVPLDLLIVYGLWVPRRRGGIVRSAKVFLLLPAIYFTVVHALSVGSLRYRVPVEPPMAILAGVALAALYERIKSGGQAPLETDAKRHHAPSSNPS